jgi:ribosome modulation factor
VLRPSSTFGSLWSKASGSELQSGGLSEPFQGSGAVERARSQDERMSLEKPGPVAANAVPEDATAEGARARTQGLSREHCPYAEGSEEEHEWLEGYDGPASQGRPLILTTCTS